MQFTQSDNTRRATPRAGLAALGMKLAQLDFFAPVREGVRIPQKTVRYAPTDKLYSVWVGSLAGGKGMVEVEQRVRADPALQAAFRQDGCAEQSVIQDTLNACTPATVEQMEAATDTIYRQHGRGYQHDYASQLQLLDADVSGTPCGRKAEFATKGYFAKQRNRRGRQLGRVLATRYEEIVVDRVFEGTCQLAIALQPLIEAAERTLELDAAKRTRTRVRVDAGGGTLEGVNWLLARGYEVLAKDYSTARASKLAQRVTKWVDDPQVPGRQVGWVEVAAPEYVRLVRRIAVRSRKANGEWGVGVLIVTLKPKAVLTLMGQSRSRRKNDAAVLLAYVHLYDGRGGAVETSLKQDKQGLGITKRNKKRMAAQQLLAQLNVLAHNALIWAREWLGLAQDPARRLGILRLCRDVFGIAGVLEFDRAGRVRRIRLNEADRMAHRYLAAFSNLLPGPPGSLILGQT